MRAESSRSPAVRRAFFDDVDLMGEIMRRYLVRAAVWAGLLLSAGAAPAFANALEFAAPAGRYSDPA